MKKIILEKDIVVYQFDANPDSLIGVNITVVFNKLEYLLIDTGYQHQMKEVLEDLEGYTCTHVINTHYHPDHTYGIYVLPEVVKIGSINSINTLLDFELENEKILQPTIVVRDTLTYTYGEHTFKMSKNIGHSQCGIIIDLDSKYLFVGDDVLITNDGKPVFPYLTLQDIKQPINAINKIKANAKNKKVIPAHGDILQTEERIKYELAIRLKYYEFIQINPDLDDFIKETGINFTGRKGWHKHNTSLIKSVS